MPGLSSVSPTQLIALSFVIAVLLSDDLPSDELAVFGNFVSIVGSLMQTIAAQMDFISSKQQKADQKQDILGEIGALRQKCDDLERRTISAEKN
jgi:hypothetical protein